ncbi:hypothetical protein [Anabaena azotica]|uniref:Uncharacterized protein n=1 Tax=Anabaena azotica FACHB-119 TaxID=947527 RepID=A0ABR8D2Z4_9NOST|nr:hypothetical protein [Anabaena azotica]MBD2500556.1 hypothetical protein [Anabaena azotica FACHB-119]
MNTPTAIQQESLNLDNSAIQQQSLSLDDSSNSLNQSSLHILDDMEFELERIMLEELAHGGLPSDIPMADF